MWNGWEILIKENKSHQLLWTHGSSCLGLDELQGALVATCSEHAGKFTCQWVSHCFIYLFVTLLFLAQWATPKRLTN